MVRKEDFSVSPEPKDEGDTKLSLFLDDIYGNSALSAEINSYLLTNSEESNFKKILSDVNSIRESFPFQSGFSEAMMLRLILLARKSSDNYDDAIEKNQEIFNIVYELLKPSDGNHREKADQIVSSKVTLWRNFNMDDYKQILTRYSPTDPELHTHTLAENEFTDRLHLARNIFNLNPLQIPDTFKKVKKATVNYTDLDPLLLTLLTSTKYYQEFIDYVTEKSEGQNKSHKQVALLAVHTFLNRKFTNHSLRQAYIEAELALNTDDEDFLTQANWIILGQTSDTNKPAQIYPGAEHLLTYSKYLRQKETSFLEKASFTEDELYLVDSLWNIISSVQMKSPYRLFEKESPIKDIGDDMYQIMIHLSEAWFSRGNTSNIRSLALHESCRLFSNLTSELRNKNLMHKLFNKETLIKIESFENYIQDNNLVDLSVDSVSNQDNSNFVFDDKHSTFDNKNTQIEIASRPRIRPPGIPESVRHIPSEPLTSVRKLTGDRIVDLDKKNFLSDVKSILTGKRTLHARINQGLTRSITRAIEPGIYKNHGQSLEIVDQDKLIDESYEILNQIQGLYEDGDVIELDWNYFWGNQRSEGENTFREPNYISDDLYKRGSAIKQVYTRFYRGVEYNLRLLGSDLKLVNTTNRLVKTDRQKLKQRLGFEYESFEASQIFSYDDKFLRDKNLTDKEFLLVGNLNANICSLLFIPQEISRKKVDYEIMLVVSPAVSLEVVPSLSKLRNNQSSDFQTGISKIFPSDYFSYHTPKPNVSVPWKRFITSKYGLEKLFSYETPFRYYDANIEVDNIHRNSELKTYTEKVLGLYMDEAGYR